MEIKGTWLTPFLASPKVVNGYDVANYYETNPTYGTKKDFDIFISEAHKRGIKVIMDLVVNHTYDEHEWFKKAINEPNSEYGDYYIFRDKPNNWTSFF